MTVLVVKNLFTQAVAKKLSWKLASFSRHLRAWSRMPVFLSGHLSNY
jgi:hypothetical protein